MIQHRSKEFWRLILSQFVSTLLFILLLSQTIRKDDDGIISITYGYLISFAVNLVIFSLIYFKTKKPIYIECLKKIIAGYILSLSLQWLIILFGYIHVKVSSKDVDYDKYYFLTLLINGLPIIAIIIGGIVGICVIYIICIAIRYNCCDESETPTYTAFADHLNRDNSNNSQV